jgi:hypothetical protein
METSKKSNTPYFCAVWCGSLMPAIIFSAVALGVCTNRFGRKPPITKNNKANVNAHHSCGSAWEKPRVGLTGRPKNKRVNNRKT